MSFFQCRRALLLAALCLSACAPTTTAGSDVETAPAPSTITVPPADTAIALSAQERETFAQSYRLMVLAELDARLLLEFAQRVEAGTLTGSESQSSFLGLGVILEAVGASLNKFVPPAALDLYWMSISANAETTQAVFTRWEDEEIDSSAVIVQLQPVIADLNATVADAGALLASRYGFDPVSLSGSRDEVMGTIPVFFETPTPAAIP